MKVKESNEPVCRVYVWKGVGGGRAHGIQPTSGQRGTGMSPLCSPNKNQGVSMRRVRKLIEEGNWAGFNAVLSWGALW